MPTFKFLIRLNSVQH